MLELIGVEIRGIPTCLAQTKMPVATWDALLVQAGENAAGKQHDWTTAFVAFLVVTLHALTVHATILRKCMFFSSAAAG